MIKKVDKQLLILTIILFAIGLIMIYSASNVTAFMVNEATPWRYFIKELIFIFVGLVGAFFLLIVDFKTYYKLSFVVTFILSIIIFSLVVWGTVTNGATNWIGFKGFGIQPSEFVKISSIVFFAFYYEKNKKYTDNKIRMIAPLVIGGIITFLIIAQKDWGTAFIYMMIVLFMFFFSNASRKIKFDVFKKGFFLLIVGIVLLVSFGDKLLGEKIERFSFNAPCDRYITDGNQLCNGFIAMDGGGLFGKGLGGSTQKYLYLPEPYTDFIFAIFVEELGIIGASVLLILYLLLIVRIVVIGKKASNGCYTLICYSFAFYIFIHIAINLGGVLGIIPMTGITLPFLSYGGSICISVIMAITIVQKVCIVSKSVKRV